MDRYSGSGLTVRALLTIASSLLVASAFAQPSLCGGADPSLLVLGIAQDAGYPQAGTKESPAFEKLVLRRFAASLAVVDPADQTRWLFEATPDFKDQLHGLDTLFPRADTPGLDGIFLTHAHIGHYAGLIHLGFEVMGADRVPVYAMPRMTDFLAGNGPWDQLVRYDNIELRGLRSDSTMRLNDRIQVTPILVPHRDEYSETVGYKIDGPNRSAVFIPDINKWDLLDEWGRRIEEIVRTVDFAFLDGTFYSAGEVGGRDMSSFPHPFIVETMERFDESGPELRSRIYFIHFNHTNPVLRLESSHGARVLSRGYHIANEGQCIGL